uniref:Granzyme M n=1 Tax=Leptobrachium leishanense TaxID=445787 RepID=A0A8C5QUB1_9ANUR
MALHRVIILLTALHCLICDAHTGPLNFHIVGGQEAIPHSKPWMAYIRYNNANDDTHVCGGFLVSKDFVMTAAHCAGRNIKVSLGLHSLGERNDENTFSVLNSFRHTNYDSKTHESDIMLLQLDHEVPLSDTIQIIALPKKNKRVPVGTLCNVAGWGQTNMGAYLPSQVLMEVNVTVVGNKHCQDVLNLPINSAMMCAGQPDTSGDAAQGDSGSPLVCNGVATGIVSFGFQNPPGVYTNIPSFLPWIRKILAFSKYP